MTSPLLDEALARARATDAASIVVDLFAVSFIDSTGLHVLIRHTRSEGGGAPRPRDEGLTPNAAGVRVSGAMEYLPFVSD